MPTTGAVRNAQKLATLTDTHAHPRLRTHALDAYNASALVSVCSDADLVINAVGPYVRGGFEIARTVLGARRPYVDFANEQSHYRHLESLDDLARRQEVPLITGAGLVPGLSTLLILHGAKQLPNAQEVMVYFAQGQVTPDEESGLGSALGGLLELSRLGGRIQQRKETMPAPIGEVEMVAVPSLEALIVPRCAPMRSVENWWALGEVPPGTAALLRLLKPHERNWAYRLFERLTRWAIRREHRDAVKEGLTTEGVLKVVVRSPDASWEGTARVENGGVATAYLPVLAAKRFAEGRLDWAGLGTPIDIFEPDATFRELAHLGWRVEIEEAHHRADSIPS